MLNALLLPPFLTKAVILEGETASGELLNIFAAKIAERGLQYATKELEDESASESDGENTKDMNGNKKEKSAMSCDATDEISYDCNNSLALLQVVAVKSLQVAAAPLLLHAEKRARAWSHRWLAHHLAPLSTPITAAPKNHSRLTVVLRNFATWLHNA